MFWVKKHFVKMNCEGKKTNSCDDELWYVQKRFENINCEQNAFCKDDVF